MYILCLLSIQIQYVVFSNHIKSMNTEPKDMQCYSHSTVSLLLVFYFYFKWQIPESRFTYFLLSQ